MITDATTNPLIDRACHINDACAKHPGRRGKVVGVSGAACQYLHICLEGADIGPSRREMFHLEDVTIQPNHQSQGVRNA